MYIVGGANGFQGSSNSGFIEKVDPYGNVVWAQGTSRPIFADAIFQDQTTGTTSLYTSIWPSATSQANIEKLDASTGAILWSDAVGPPANSVGGTGVRGRAMAVDASGNVYVASQFSGTGDFDPGPGTADLSSTAGSWDPFLYKLDPSGNLLSARSMGGNMGSGLAVDASGNIYTAGSYGGAANFDTGSQTVSLTSPGSTSLFLVKTTQDTGMIFGRVFNDLNNNGVFDAGLESGIPNVTVYLDLNNSGSYVAGDPTATTDSQGYFHFSDVVPDIYTLRQIAPSGYTATPASLAVSVAAGLASETTGFADFTPNKTRTYSNTTAVSTSKGKPNAISSLTVPDSYTVLGMTLTLNVSNAKDNTLSIFLTGPNGTRVSVGSTNQNGTLTFQVPDFDYTLVKGPWKLEVDGLGQGGVLKSWSLSIDGTLS